MPSASSLVASLSSSLLSRSLSSLSSVSSSSSSLAASDAKSSSSSSSTVALSLFVVSSYWFLRQLRRRNGNEGAYGAFDGEYEDDNDNNNEYPQSVSRGSLYGKGMATVVAVQQGGYQSGRIAENGTGKGSFLRGQCLTNGGSDDDGKGASFAVGRRGLAALKRPAVPYLQQFLSCLESQCHPVLNPGGHIPLCIAENRLVLDLISARFVQMTAAGGGGGGGGGDFSSSSAAATTSTSSAGASSLSPLADPRTYCYNSFLGMPIARDAAAYFLARHLLFRGGGDEEEDEDEDNDGVGPGDGIPRNYHRQSRRLWRRSTLKKSNQRRRGKKDRQENGGGGGNGTDESDVDDLLLIDEDSVDNDEEGEEEEHPPNDRVSLAARAALEAVQSRHVVLATGAAALLNHLFVLLGDSLPSSPSSYASKSGYNSNKRGRECCLIPAPYYAAFDNHCRLVAGVVPFAITQSDPTAGPATLELDAAFRQAEKKGLVPRFLLITNPNNPLGVIYSPETMRRLVRWGRLHNLHVIVDEVYALSTHSTSNSPLHDDSRHGQLQQQQPHHHSRFESILRVLDNHLGHDVHLVYALSKDFGASGLRVGILYTQNEDLLEALPSVNIFTCVPGPIQLLVAQLLTDDAFVNGFLQTSRARLALSYQICSQKLDEMVIPYVAAEAGVFVYADFSSLMPPRVRSSGNRRDQYDWEDEFGRLLFRYARLVLTPGGVQHDPHPGRFRICFGWVSVEVLQIAMERLSRFVAKVRRLDWEDLNERTLSGVLDVGLGSS